MSSVPRLRVIAGPNGSGKSTLLDTLRRELTPEQIGAYVNADDIERALRSPEGFDVTPFGLELSEEQARAFFERDGAWIVPKRGLGAAEALRLAQGRLSLPGHQIDSYVAAVIADLLRRLLLAARRTFTFETVMSSSSKVDFVSQAAASGYRTYLYFVATSDPEINVQRVASRVEDGGHPVPEAAIRSRYERSIELLLPALRASTRGYVFDNSADGARRLLLAEKLDTGEIELRAREVTPWFSRAVLEKIYKQSA